MTANAAAPAAHRHVFLGEGHERSERRTWGVIWLCGIAMALEIVGGLVFGSMALVADGLHMSTHAMALLLAALAYAFARRNAEDPRFTFGTGKLGDLAGYSSAIILAMIALLIGYESVMRFISPVPIHFREAIPIACLGLLVNVLSVWLLSGGGHDHHGHGHHHGGERQADEERRIATTAGTLLLSIFEDGVPPRFRLRAEHHAPPGPEEVTLETVRPDGTRQAFALRADGAHLESVDEIPEPHAFTVRLGRRGEVHELAFEEHEHGTAASRRDNNMRAALVHVLADAAVSILVIIGLVLARCFGWQWMDPAVGIIGAGVIASWAYGLVRDTGAILLDMNPDRQMLLNIQRAIEDGGDQIADLHLWRLGPGHLGAVASIRTTLARGPQYYHDLLARFRAISHLTVEVHQSAQDPG